MSLFKEKSFTLHGPLDNKAVFALCLLFFLIANALYGLFFWSPPVFDDDSIFKSLVLQDYSKKFSLRWFSYATFSLTYHLFGPKLFWFRLGNMLLHAATAMALFFFLRRLFFLVLKEKPVEGLSNDWLAFFAALIFLLHPVAVYDVGYLIQRSTVMATLFGLLMLLSFMEGVVRGRNSWFFISTLFYFLAVFSKEHAIMLPAVTLPLLFLLGVPVREWLKKFGLAFGIYALCGIFVAMSFRGILGASYEIDAQAQISRLSADAPIANSYILSVLTQSWLFFKYVFLWILPNPQWMSIDMREPFAASLFSWPQSLGGFLFVFYPVVAVKLLLKRGSVGLAGFAMLFPWILFMTEFSAVRIQESFVLYRSYLWMAGGGACFPFLFSRFPAKASVSLLLLIGLAMFPLARDRLVSLSSPLLLWSDAVKLVEGKSNLTGLDRIYYNRGDANLQAMNAKGAISDFSKVIELSPKIYQAYFSRGNAYFFDRQLDAAVRDYGQAIRLSPRYAEAYYMRGNVYVQLGKKSDAEADFRKSCDLGHHRSCVKWQELK